MPSSHICAFPATAIPDRVCRLRCESRHAQASGSVVSTHTAGNTVAELKAVLLEREDVELLVVEIAINLTAVACEATLVEIVPHGHHDMHELQVAEMVVEHRQQVFVDAEDTDCILRWEHIVFYHLLIALGEGVQIECGGIGFLKLLYGHHQHWGVDHDARRGKVELS